MLDWERLKEIANADGEFRLQARFWNATLKIANGPDATRIALRDGEITAVEPWFGGIGSDLAISAPPAQWDALLAPVPKPFYQDLHAATVHHGFTAAGNRTHYCAYYPAVRRLIELMRELNNADETSPQTNERAVAGRNR
ncbi:MAG: hypothetical protein OXF68_02500 [Gammaproteobacteria bacterium]|nr:hypothetical protein [Gammaproteobacteria bacterium]